MTLATFVAAASQRWPHTRFPLLVLMVLLLTLAAGWTDALCYLALDRTVAITGTELLLGIRLAERIGRRSAGQPGATSTVPFLVMLLLSYAGRARRRAGRGVDRYAVHSLPPRGGCPGASGHAGKENGRMIISQPERPRHRR